MCTVVEGHSHCHDYFFRPSGFPDLLRKVYLMGFEFSLFVFLIAFLREQHLLSVSLMERDYNYYTF